MKRFALAFAVIAASAAYVLSQGLGRSGSPLATASPAVLPAQPAPATPAPATSPVTSNAPAPAPAPKSAGQYVDGTYVGNAADAYYGMVQVRATIAGGKLADVTFLSYPSDRSTSRFINSQAMPYLTQEAIQAQSAAVDVVSGATDTSLAFRSSLASALDAAKR